MGSGKGGKKHKPLSVEGAKLIRDPKAGQRHAPAIQAKRNKKKKEREAELYAEERKAAASLKKTQETRIRRTSQVLAKLEARDMGLTEEELRQDQESHDAALAKLSPKQLQDLQDRITGEAEAVFKVWDVDGNGVLDQTELKNALGLAGFNFDEDEIQDILEEFDEDKNGVMDIDEFIIMFQVLYVKGQREKSGIAGNLLAAFKLNSNALYNHPTLTDQEVEQYKRLFVNGDTSGDMQLDDVELMRLLVEQGLLHGQREQVFSAMASMDSNGDGHVDLGEFLDFMGTVKNLKHQSTPLWTRITSWFSPQEDVTREPETLAPTYFKVARWDGSVQPNYEKRWVEMTTEGTVLLKKKQSRNLGSVPIGRMRPVSIMRRPSVAGADEAGSVLSGSSEEDTLDLSYVNRICISEHGNIAGTKFEVHMLKATFLFRADTREVAEKWVHSLSQWRDYQAYLLWKQQADILEDEMQRGPQWA